MIKGSPILFQFGIVHFFVRAIKRILGDENLLPVVIAGQQQVMGRPKIITRPEGLLQGEGFLDHNRETSGDEPLQGGKASCHSELCAQGSSLLIDILRQLFNVDIPVLAVWFDHSADIGLAALPAIHAQGEGERGRTAIVPVLDILL